MVNREAFQSQLAAAILLAPCMPNGIPLVGYNELETKHASMAPLISVLADIVLTTCVRPSDPSPQAHGRLHEVLYETNTNQSASAPVERYRQDTESTNWHLYPPLTR